MHNIYSMSWIGQLLDVIEVVALIGVAVCVFMILKITIEDRIDYHKSKH